MSTTEDIGREPRVPAIPKTPIADPKIRHVIDAVRTLLETRTDEGVDRWLTWRDLVQNGIVTYQIGNRTIKGDSNVYFPVGGGSSDFSIPPTPENVTATGSLGTVFIEWTGNEYSNHAYAEVWRSAVNNLGTAVLQGTSQSGIYVDSVGAKATYYYWVRFVSKADVKGSYQGTTGVTGVTSLSPSYVLEILENQINEDQLTATLNTRIDTYGNQIVTLQGQVADLSEAPTYSASETYATDDIVKYDGALYRALSSTTGNVPTNTTYWLKIGDYTSVADAVAELVYDVGVLETSLTTTDGNLAAEVTARSTLAAQIRGSYTGSDINSLTTGLLHSESQARATADTSLASSISVLSASKNRSYRQPAAPSGTAHAVGDIWFASTDNNRVYRWDGFNWVASDDVRITANAAAIVTEQTARISGDNALATSITNLTSTVNSNLSTVNAAISSEASTRASADTALTSQINTLSSTVTTNNTTLTAAVQTEATTRASVDNGLLAQYTVKVDVNGRVAGFGLASTSISGTPTSSFIVIADKFAVVSPSNTGETPKVPFVVGTVDGQTVVAISNAMIQDAAISNAKIGTAAITTAKIADLSVSSAKIAEAAITTAKIADAAIGTAQIAFAAVDTANINNGAITNAKIQDAAITNAKISGAIQSSDFSFGSAGWRIDKTGAAEFNNAVFRGTIDVKSATSGARLEIKNNVIKVIDASGVVRAKIGDLTA